jgi:transcriptional regulator NrdR family protein
VFDSRPVGADRRVRRRLCRDCGTRFVTIEKVFDPVYENAIYQQKRQSLMDQLSDFLTYAGSASPIGDENSPGITGRLRGRDGLPLRPRPRVRA